MSDYTVVYKDTLPELVDEVKELIAKDYVPSGGVAVIDNYRGDGRHFMQAMYRDCYPWEHDDE